MHVLEAGRRQEGQRACAAAAADGGVRVGRVSSPEPISRSRATEMGLLPAVGLAV